MKLFLVAPRPPKGLKVSAQKEGGTISVRADLLGLKMPWPLMVTVRNPQGEELYKVYRATPANGTYQEVFPLGTNAAEGSYTVEVKSPLANLGEKSKVNHSKGNATPKVLSEDVRAFDADTIKSFLAKKPAVTIAIGDDAHKGIAQKLATALSARGLTVSVKPDSEVLTKVHYPRVWNPYAKVYSPTGSEKPLAGKKIENRIHLATDKSGKVTAKTVDGKELNNWRLPHSVVTIGGEGFVNWSGDDEFCYLPGVKLYVEKNRRPTVIKGTAEEKKTSKEFREKWAKPWMKLRTHVGGYQLPPQLPEAYTTKEHLILLGDSTSSHAVAIVQASDLLLQVVDKQYPGPGKALISFIWSPFEVEKNVILVGASDQEGITKGIDHLLKLAP